MALPTGLSATRKATKVAQRTVDAYLRDEGRRDPFERALHDAGQRLDPDPVEALATGAGNLVAERFMVERLKLYEARACQQLSGSAWASETAAIGETVKQHLARRFRDYLK